jgi:Tfp pilus assembly protein PilF
MEQSESILSPLQGAIACHRSGRFQHAIALYETMLQRVPDHAQTLYLCGLAYQELKELDDAMDYMQRAVRAAPQESHFHASLGLLLRRQGRGTAAMESLKTALRLNPADIEARFHLGDLYMDAGRIPEAVEQLVVLLQQDPGCVPAHVNLGLCFKARGELDRALIEFRRALLLEPDNAMAHVNHALTMLLAGDYQNGWREYEWRFQLEEVRSHIPALPVEIPQWQGDSLAGRRLIVLSEQGYGDNLQFIRYVPLLKARGATVLFECLDPLWTLFEQVEGIDQLVRRQETVGVARRCDRYCHLMSLPRLFGTTLETIPEQDNRQGYLRPSADRVACWREILAASVPSGDRALLRVGLVWQGKPLHRQDPSRYRSCPLSLLLPLAGLEGVALVSLQTGGDTSGALHPDSGRPIVDVTEHLTDFHEVAAAMANLDLVITIDTATAHLAGAMGKSTWLLLPYAPDWRWGMSGNRTPWYPTVTLFRQTTPGEWEGPIRQMEQKLATLVRMTLA